MRWLAELSNNAQEQFAQLPHNIQDRISRAIDEFEAKDDSQWSNIKALRSGVEGAAAQAHRPLQDYFLASSLIAASWRSQPYSSNRKARTGNKLDEVERAS